jgi:hypothetical protein
MALSCPRPPFAGRTGRNWHWAFEPSDPFLISPSPINAGTEAGPL